MQIEPNQFLVKNGSSANPSLVFTSLNGFAGNVTLGATVTPAQSSSPTVWFNSSTIELNASQPGSLSIQMIVRTTDRTESGLYNFTVTGSSVDLSHSATATVGVTNRLVPSNGADLVFKAHFATTAYLGGSTVLENTFEDLGYLGIGITNFTVSLDIGTFNIDQCGEPVCVIYNQFHPYVSLSPYEEKTTALTIQIPNGTSIGYHSVTITIGWVLYGANFYTQSAPDLIAHESLEVYSQPSNPSPNHATNIPNGILRLLPPILGGLTIIVVCSVGLVYWNGRRSEKRNLAMLQYVASAKQSLTQKTCSNCGAPAGFQDKFCGNCGHMIS
jgi:hypothetical protein